MGVPGVVVDRARLLEPGAVVEPLIEPDLRVLVHQKRGHRQIPVDRQTVHLAIVLGIGIGHADVVGHGQAKPPGWAL